MIGHVIFPDINNIIARVRYAIKSSIITSFIIKEVEASVSTTGISIQDFSSNSTTVLPGHFRICIHGIHAALVLFRNWHYGFPYAQEVSDVLERQLQEHSSIS